MTLRRLKINQLCGSRQQGTSEVPGSAEVRTYFFILLVVQLMTVSYEDHTSCTSIFDGTTIERLLLPEPVIADAFGVNLSLRFWHTIFGLPILAAVAIAVGLRLDPADLLLAVPAVVWPASSASSSRSQ